MNENKIDIANVDYAPKDKKPNSLSGVIHKIAGRAHKRASEKADKNKIIAQQKLLEKYNPVYSKNLEESGFYMPNLLMIEDDVRRGESDVLKDAIGWVTKEKDTPIFHLFEDSVDAVGLNFLPYMQSDALYCVDNFNKNCYVKVDNLFSIVRDEKMAELKHIACCLGAKSCTIEFKECRADMSGLKAGIKSKLGSVRNESFKEKSETNEGKIEIKFKGSQTPTRPELKWFLHDQNINRLIEARCGDMNDIKRESIRLLGNMSAAMSQQTACKIDKILKISGKGSIEKQAAAELKSEFVFEIKF